MAQMHVRDANGSFYTGVDAFMTIWQAYPSGSLYRMLSALVGLPGINLFTRLGYSVFARYRHLLPKRHQDCDSGTCNLNDRL
jgi:predicted DCC family thiol-disulfide oxidoreductase YuxK